MSEKIIALVDGSTYSASVCENAAWIAARTGAPVQLMHVIGRREGAETRDHSGAIALGARTALLNELAQLDEQRAKLTMERGRAILDDARPSSRGPVSRMSRQGCGMAILSRRWQRSKPRRGSS